MIGYADTTNTSTLYFRCISGKIEKRYTKLRDVREMCEGRDKTWLWTRKTEDVLSSLENNPVTFAHY